MRMAELARRSGCTVPTIKYYLREGLLPPGQETAPTQADYGEHHLERLRLIRVLRDVGGIPVSGIGRIMAAIDDTDRPLHDVLGEAHHALGPPPPPPDQLHAEARAELVAHVLARGWDVLPSAPAFHVLATALVALRRRGIDAPVTCFDVYADLVLPIAELELSLIDPSHGPADTVAQVIVGTVVFEQAMVALRRLAEEHHSNQRFGGRAPEVAERAASAPPADPPPEGWRTNPPLT